MKVEVVPSGNLANQMLQLMFLESLREQFPHLEIVGVNLPDWGIKSKIDCARARPPHVRLIGQFVDRGLLVNALTRGWLREFEFAAGGFRMSNLATRSRAIDLFPAKDPAPPSTNSDELLINVRGAETLNDVHVDYGPLPISYLRSLVDKTGLKPVLMGQLSDDWYSTALRAEFSGCKVLPSQGPRTDFEVLRRAHHIAISLSTFSWLASWLSNATTIHMPVYGIFNPLQRPDINLLPIDDPRYRFYNFGLRQWRATPEQIKAIHAPGIWEELTTAMLRERIESAESRWRPKCRRYKARFYAAIICGRMGWKSRVGQS